MKPTNHSRRVLLAVTGLSPQVVTETLYALAVNRGEQWIPTEVRIITTEEGAERVRHSLLNPEHGHFHRLCQEYDLPVIDFTMAGVHVIRDDSGEPLEDIRSEQDNERCANTITEMVRELTADSESSLHVSIAGGRKTMGYYLGYALSLYGRSQDRLSHVLVSAPYESHPDFYYPTKESRLIHTRDDRSRAYDTSEAQVSLAEIPFVRLRDGLPRSLQKGEASFNQTVIAAQRALEAPELIIDLDYRCLSVSGEIIDQVSPGALAFYSWMARRCRAASDPVRYDDDEDVAGEFLAEYRRIVGANHGDYEKAENSLNCGMGKEDFEYRMSRANRVLKEKLPPQLFERYKIMSFGRRPKTRYGLGLAADDIKYEGLLPSLGQPDAR